MSEKDNGQNLDERMAACPVYRKVKVESVLDELEMGEDLRPLFHELVYLRGEWPETMDEAQMWEFANRANDLVIENQVSNDDEEFLLAAMHVVVEEWLFDQVRNN